MIEEYDLIMISGSRLVQDFFPIDWGKSGCAKPLFRSLNKTL